MVLLNNNLTLVCTEHRKLQDFRNWRSFWASFLVFSNVHSKTDTMSVKLGLLCYIIKK